MKVYWTFSCSLLLGLVATSLSQDCSVTHVMHCYDFLAYYEGLGFPFYGGDDLDLVETCREINDTFECVEEYVDWCKGKSECDKECQQMIQYIKVFSNNTGLKFVQKELCNPKSSLRQAYLENYSCLKSNEKNYAACHNVSLMSQEYMTTIHDPMEGISARCCFFTWYHDCFTNITRDNCNENATLFISSTLHTLLSQMSVPLCGPNPDVCDKPPLPSHETNPVLEDHDVTDIDKSLEREREKWDDLIKKDINSTIEVDNSLEHNFAGEDNSLESHPKSPGSSRTYSLWTITMYFFHFIVVLFSVKKFY